MKSIPSVFMNAMNIQNDVIGIVLRENCKSKQMTDIIAWPSRCHGRISEWSYIMMLVVSLNKCTIWIQLNLYWSSIMQSCYWKHAHFWLLATIHSLFLLVCLMVFSATFNNISAISWRSVFLVEETGGPGENHRSIALFL